MRTLSTPPKPTATPENDEATKICFRYRGGRRHHRLYDVFMTLDDPGGACRIEIREAVAAGADVPPFTSGRLSAARLMRAFDLIGLVKRITARDRGPSEPGRLLYDAHMQIPYYPGTAAPRVDTSGADTSGVATSLARRSVPVGASRRRSNQAIAEALHGALPTTLQAHAKVRYPLHGMGRGATLRRHARGG